MFCRKNKKYYFEKKWECHGTPGTPGVDGPAPKANFNEIYSLSTFALLCFFLH